MLLSGHVNRNAARLLRSSPRPGLRAMAGVVSWGYKGGCMRLSRPTYPASGVVATQQGATFSPCKHNLHHEQGCGLHIKHSEHEHMQCWQALAPTAAPYVLTRS